MEPNYWSSILSNRQISRRRLVIGAGGAATAAMALSLAGCGGGSSDSKKTDSSSLLAKGEDTTKVAKPGGTWPSYYPEDVINMDPILNNASPTFPQLMPVYSNLVKAGVSTTKRPGADAITGDAAESWEFSPDGTQDHPQAAPEHEMGRPSADQRPRPRFERREMELGPLRRHRQLRPGAGEVAQPRRAGRVRYGHGPAHSRVQHGLPVLGHSRLAGQLPELLRHAQGRVVQFQDGHARLGSLLPR